MAGQLWSDSFAFEGSMFLALGLSRLPVFMREHSNSTIITIL